MVVCRSWHSSRSQSSGFNSILNSASRISRSNLVTSRVPRTSSPRSKIPRCIFFLFFPLFFRFTFSRAETCATAQRRSITRSLKSSLDTDTRAARTSPPRAVQADIESPICISAASQCSRLTTVIPATGLRSDAFAMHYTDAPSQRRKRRRIESDKRLRSLSLSLFLVLSSSVVSHRRSPLFIIRERTEMILARGDSRPEGYLSEITPSEITDAAPSSVVKPEPTLLSFLGRGNEESNPPFPSVRRPFHAPLFSSLRASGHASATCCTQHPLSLIGGFLPVSRHFGRMRKREGSKRERESLVRHVTLGPSRFYDRIELYPRILHAEHATFLYLESDRTSVRTRVACNSFDKRFDKRFDPRWE